MMHGEMLSYLATFVAVAVAAAGAVYWMTARNVFAGRTRKSGDH